MVFPESSFCGPFVEKELQAVRNTLRKPSLQWKTLRTGATSTLEYLVELRKSEAKSIVPSSWVQVTHAPHLTGKRSMAGFAAPSNCTSAGLWADQLAVVRVFWGLSWARLVLPSWLVLEHTPISTYQRLFYWLRQKRFCGTQFADR